MKFSWQVLLALVTLCVLFVGWGVSYGSLNTKAAVGVQAAADVHEVEICVAGIEANLSRLPLIEAKLDKVLGL